MRSRRFSLLAILLTVLMVALSCAKATPTPTPKPAPTTTSTPPVTPIMKPPALNWIRADSGAVISAGTFSQGKLVRLKEEDWPPGQEPTRFTIHEARGRFLGAVWDWIGMRLGIKRPPIAPIEMPAVRISNRRVESRDVWQTGVPGRDNQTMFYFRDDYGNESSYITVSKTEFAVGSTRIGIQVNGVIKGPAGIPIGLKMVADSGKVTYTVEAVKDPALRAVALVPWADDPRSLRAFLIAYLRELQQFAPELKPDVMLQEFGQGFYSEKEPLGWAISVTDESFSVAPGEPAQVTVNISTPSAGRGAFALKVFDAADPSRYVVSTILEIVCCQRR